MELIFEIVSRSGRVLERQRARGVRFSVGRAYDNDFIVTDETVSPHHALLDFTDADNALLKDLDSLNGISTAQHEKIVGQTAIKSGQQYQLGQARIRIYRATDSVAETVPLGGVDGIANLLGGHAMLGVMLMSVLSIAFVEQWFNTFVGDMWPGIALNLVGIIAMSGVIASIWAIVGRVLKHEGRWRTHFVLFLGYLGIQSIVVFGYDLVLFNSLNRVFSIAIGLSITLLVLTAYLWLSIYIAANANSLQRRRFAIGISALIVGVSVSPQLLELTEFSKAPSYISVVMPPVARFADGQPLEAYMESSAALFDKSETLAAKK